MTTPTDGDQKDLEMGLVLQQQQQQDAGVESSLQPLRFEDVAHVDRIYTHNNMKIPNGITSFTVNPFCCEEVWDRLKYSVDDIDQIVASADAVSLWKLALIEGFVVTFSAVKISYSRPDQVDCAGKCWGAGTKLMLYDGTSKAVEDIQAGDLLMGDDNTPRTVQPGTVISEEGPMYRITSMNDGCDSWTCNDDHILVVKINERPKLHQQNGRWQYRQWKVDPVTNLAEYTVTSFATEEAAREGWARLMETWRPPVWECSVKQYLKSSVPGSRAGMMYKPLMVQPRLPDIRLASVLDAAMKGSSNHPPNQPSRQHILDTAWVIGMWLADGTSTRPEITQIKECMQTPHHGHEAAIDKLEAWYHTSTGVDTQQHPITFARKEPTSSGNTAYTIYLRGVFASILTRYQLLGHKGLLHGTAFDLLREDEDIRLALLAGLLDGDGYYDDRRNLYEIAAKQRDFMDGVVRLARSVGLSTGKVSARQCTDKLTGKTYSGWRINIGGSTHRLRQHLVLAYKQAPVPDDDFQPVRDPLCDGFKIEPIGIGRYHGFTLDGNGRCLLDDFTVTHNTVILKKLRKHLRQKYANRVGGEYFNKIPGAGTGTVKPPPPVTLVKDETTEETTDESVVIPAVVTGEENQAVPLIARMRLTDDECDALHRACGSIVTRKTRVYPNIFVWRDTEWLPYDVDSASGCVVLVEVMPQLDHWRRYGKPTCFKQEPFNFRVTERHAIYSDTSLMIEVTSDSGRHAMTIPEHERYKIIKPIKPTAAEARQANAAATLAATRRAMAANAAATAAADAVRTNIIAGAQAVMKELQQK